MRYECIHRRRDSYPVDRMCRLLKVSSSGYYAGGCGRRVLEPDAIANC